MPNAGDKKSPKTNATNPNAAKTRRASPPQTTWRCHRFQNCKRLLCLRRFSYSLLRSRSSLTSSSKSCLCRFTFFSNVMTAALLLANSARSIRSKPCFAHLFSALSRSNWAFCQADWIRVFRSDSIESRTHSTIVRRLRQASLPTHCTSFKTKGFRHATLASLSGAMGPQITAPVGTAVRPASVPLTKPLGCRPRHYPALSPRCGPDAATSCRALAYGSWRRRRRIGARRSG